MGQVPLRQIGFLAAEIGGFDLWPRKSGLQQIVFGQQVGVLQSQALSPSRRLLA